MMRWLKEKKRDKRANSVGHDDDGGQEEEEGFDKEKPASKSPLTKRQLPPTPLSPEENSPHIYEEIHDLQVTPTCPQGVGTASPHKQRRRKHGSGSAIVPAPSPSSWRPAREASWCRDQSISPYMVVPVDEDVRQTPTHFHRTGTPEVHCDVIIKDTHCEILLSRKPKVSAFRLDSVTAPAGSKSASNGLPVIRNNTHFCSQNRRASVDAHSPGGKAGSASGAWNSSAFSSSSACRANSTGTSTVSLSTLSERAQAWDDQASAGSSAKGVMTYSVGGTFIPRATSLAFHPLKPLDVDDVSLSNQDPFFSMMPPPGEPNLPQPPAPVTGVHRAPHARPDSPVSYSSIPIASGTPGTTGTPQAPSRPGLDPVRAAYSPSQTDAAAVGPCRGFPSAKPTHAIVRPASPSPSSSSSSCTYASVSFPTEPKVYNTIAPDLISQETTRQMTSHTIAPNPHLDISAETEMEPDFERYSSVRDPHCRHPDHAAGVQIQGPHGKFPHRDRALKDSSVYSGVLPYRADVNDAFHGETLRFSGCDRNNNNSNNNSNNNNNNPSLDNNPAAILSRDMRVEGDGESVLYSDITGTCGPESAGGGTVYACIHSNDPLEDQSHLLDGPATPGLGRKDVIIDSIDTTEADVDRILYGQAPAPAGGLLLDFCTCAEEQHGPSGCGYAGGGQEDDTSSIATSLHDPHDPHDPCLGCGRLVRQITYSESYSDETYEHAYSSRLLLRRGRRFSSPDLSLSEPAASLHGSEPDSWDRPGLGVPATRDDLWTARGQHAASRLHLAAGGGGGGGGGGDDPSSDRDVTLAGHADPVSPPHRVNPTVPSGAGRKSFSALTSPDSQPDTSRTDAILALHRASLPSKIAPNLVPVTSSMTSTTTGTHHHHHHHQQQPKASAFSHLFSLFSRPKSKQLARPDDGAGGTDEIKAGVSLEGDGSACPRPTEVHPEQIPEKNTTRLSKFFQRLASSEADGSVGSMGSDGPRGRDRRRDAASMEVKADPPGHPAVHGPKLLRSPFDPKGSTGKREIYPDGQEVTEISSPPPESPLIASTKANGAMQQEEDVSVGQEVSVPSDKPRASNRADVALSQVTETCIDQLASIGAAGLSSLDQASAGAEPNPKPPNKTDSGDTCYEYDISTSSESEPTSYDCFLSKVKKSLNLEHEVQQMADLNAQRKKMFCKKCKKSDGHASMDSGSNPDGDSLGSEPGCPLLSAKFGDLRKIFGDFVVDQRAAILDCLTDYAHGPFTVKVEGQENVCRECGGEIVTSDSESMTTVYSILSQQLRMTSPGVQTPSCDSDEGTMADNSCESADDEEASSGYEEEATGPEWGGQRARRREKTRDKKDRKVHQGSGGPSHRDTDRSRRKGNSSSLPHSSKKEEQGGGANARRAAFTFHQGGQSSKCCPECTQHEKGAYRVKMDGVYPASTLPAVGDLEPPRKDGLSDAPASGTRSPTVPSPKHDEVSAKPKARLLPAEKVIQDIYAPLPSKARLWLTARSGDSPQVGSTSTARPPQSPPVASGLPHAPSAGLEEDTARLPDPCGDKTGAGMTCKASELHPRPSDSPAGRPDAAQVGCHRQAPDPKPVDAGTLRGSTSHSNSNNSHSNKDSSSNSNSSSNNNNSNSKSSNKSSNNNSNDHVKPSSCLPGPAKVQPPVTSVCYSGSHRNRTDANAGGLPSCPERSSVAAPAPSSTQAVESISTISPEVGSSVFPSTPCEGKTYPTHSVEVSKSVARSGVASLRVQPHASQEPTDGRGEDEIKVNEVRKTPGDAVESIPVQKQKPELSRRQKQKELQMAALDLLPETVLGGDADVEELKSPDSAPPQRYRGKSSLVGRLARMFEGSDTPTPASQGNDCSHVTKAEREFLPKTENRGLQAASDARKPKSFFSPEVKGRGLEHREKTASISPCRLRTGHAPSTTSGDADKDSCQVRSPADSPIVHPPVQTSSSPPVPTPLASTPATTMATPSSGVGPGQKAGSSSHGRSFTTAPLSPAHPPPRVHRGHTTPASPALEGVVTTRLNTHKPEVESKVSGVVNLSDSSAKPKVGRKKEAKREGVGERKTRERRKSREAGPEDRRGESRSRKQIVSPSPSSSSGSSSKRRGQSRQKKLSRKSHLNRRARSKSERRRGQHEVKDERTPYYLTSDMSDIDVIEVDDWEAYQAARGKGDNSRTLKLKTSGDTSGKRDVVSGKAGHPAGTVGNHCAANLVGKTSPHPTGKEEKEQERDGNEEGEEEEAVVQEVYSIPPSSSEIRRAAGQGDGGSSAHPAGQMSPEVARATAKSKKTDIYKTKSNSNKLLSDLIIRNYDRQMYDAGSSNV